MLYEKFKGGLPLQVILGLFLIIGIASPPRAEPSGVVQQKQAWDPSANTEQRRPPIFSPEVVETFRGSDDKSAADWWMVKLTVALIGVGLLQSWVFFVQAKRLKQTIDKMDEIDTRQATKVAESIAQATRAAEATVELAKASKDQAVMTQRIAEQNRINKRPFMMIFAKVTKVSDGQYVFSYILENFGITPLIVTDPRILLQAGNGFTAFDANYVKEIQRSLLLPEVKGVVVRANSASGKFMVDIPFISASETYIAGYINYQDFFGGDYSVDFSYSVTLPDLKLKERHGMNCKNNRR